MRPKQPKRGHIREHEEFRQRKERDRKKYHRPPPGKQVEEIEYDDARRD